MIILRKVKSVFRILSREREWHRDSRSCRKKLLPKQLQDIPVGKKLVLMPHSDDEWIGCSQILLYQPEQTMVINMDMSGGDDKQLHLLRRKEAESVAKKYGYRFSTVQNRLSDLKQIMLDEKPSCVFLPCYIDWHKEHIEVMRTFHEAARQVHYSGMVGMYQVSLPMPEKLINAGKRMSKRQWREKWKSLTKMYKTQAFLPVKRFMLNEYINGGVSNSYSLEAYCLLNFQEWDWALRHGIMSDECQKKVMRHLQEIRNVRQIIGTCGGAV